MPSFGSSFHAVVLVCFLSLSAIAPAASQSVPLSLVKAPVSMSIIPVAEGESCFMQQGHCEDRCTGARASGDVNACFHQCQAEKDRCDAEQH